uniref:Uncharacterized protein n=1 Tax=Sparus aurata TaxID=8175 RepID=A0A671XSV6_SPAAU
MANKKAMRYLDDLHSAELDLCSHKEELLRLRSECLSPPPSFSQCDSGYSDSHSSLDGRSTPSPLRRCEQFSTDPKSLGMKSVPQPPLRDRDNSNMTSHPPETDSEVTGSLSSRRYSTHYPHSLMHDTFIRAAPSERGTRSLQECPTSSLHLHEGDNSWPAPASQLDRTAAWDVNVHRNASLEGPRFEELESMARDIEHFEPDNCDHHVENYLSSLDHCLADLHRATQREKVKLVEKTSSKALHKFIETQPPSIRDDYKELCHTLKEEFSSTADEATGIVAAIQVKHSRRKHPRDYYICFRHAYFQGRNAPGLKENPIFKVLFVKNLHPCVRPHVEMSTRQENLSLKEIRKMTQVAWETMVNLKSSGKTPEPAFSNNSVSKIPCLKTSPSQQTKGG